MASSLLGRLTDILGFERRANEVARMSRDGFGYAIGIGPAPAREGDEELDPGRDADDQRRMGSSEAATVYAAFGSKRALLLAQMDRMDDLVDIGGRTEELNCAAGDPEELIRIGAGISLSFSRRHADIVAFLRRRRASGARTAIGTAQHALWNRSVVWGALREGGT